MAKNAFELPSFAKINWFLQILGKRADNFHELCTLFQTVSLYDTLVFKENEELILTCDLKHIPTNDKNLIIKAAKILQERFIVKTGAAIHLKKRIPSPGGLGGGSSNAAVAVLGLCKLWKIEPDFQEILEIGKMLGSDVPFFFFGGTALGTGRGTEIAEAPEISSKHLLIVTPPDVVSTTEAFDDLQATRLTNQISKSILQICRAKALSFDLRQNDLTNDFERSVFRAAPEIKRVKEKLFQLGAVQASLSGSGASVFAIFDNQETRQAAQKAIDKEKTWRKFAVATISRSEYRDALKPCESLLPISF